MPSAEWACSVCGRMNKSKVQSCIVCGKRRLNGNEQQKAAVSAPSPFKVQTVSAAPSATVIAKEMNHHDAALEEMKEYAEKVEQQSNYDVEHLRRYQISYMSGYKICWDLTVCCCVAFVAMTVPLQIAYESEFTGFWFVLSAFVDCLFWLDIPIAFQTTFPRDDGREECRPSKIAFNYLKGFFLIDLTSCIPGFPTSLLLSGEGSEAQSAKVLKASKLVKALRGLKVLKLLRVLKMGSLMQTIELRFMVARKLMQAIKLLFTTIFIAHMLACSWAIAGRINGRDEWTGNSWMVSYGIQDVDDSGQYLSAIYWSLTTLTTVGYGDITPATDQERIFCMIGMCFGGAYYGYVIGNITAMMSTLNLQQSHFDERMEEVQSYMKHHSFPKDMTMKVCLFFKHYYEQKSSLNESEILSILSGPLKEQVAQHLLADTIAQISFLAPLLQFSNSLTKLIPLMQPTTASTGELVVRRGDNGNNMYILKDGFLDTVPNHRFEVIERINIGDCFGHFEAFGLSSTRSHSVCASTVCHLVSINGPQLLQSLDDHPHAKNLILDNISQMYESFIVSQLKNLNRESYTDSKHQLNNTRKSGGKSSQIHPIAASKEGQDEESQSGTSVFNPVEHRDQIRFLFELLVDEDDPENIDKEEFTYLADQVGITLKGTRAINEAFTKASKRENDLVSFDEFFEWYVKRRGGDPKKIQLKRKRSRSKSRNELLPSPKSSQNQRLTMESANRHGGTQDSKAIMATLAKMNIDLSQQLSAMNDRLVRLEKLFHTSRV
eukprot:g2947.t1